MTTMNHTDDTIPATQDDGIRFGYWKLDSDTATDDGRWLAFHNTWSGVQTRLHVPEGTHGVDQIVYGTKGGALIVSMKSMTVLLDDVTAWLEAQDTEYQGRLDERLKAVRTLVPDFDPSKPISDRKLGRIAPGDMFYTLFALQYQWVRKTNPGCNPVPIIAKINNRSGYTVRLWKRATHDRGLI